MFGTLGFGVPGAPGLVPGVRDPGFGLLGLVVPGLVLGLVTLLELPEQFSLSIRTDVTRRCCALLSAPAVPDVPAVDDELRERRDVLRCGTTVPMTSTR